MSATPNKNPPTYCRTGVVRGSYVKVFTPTINEENGKAEYSMTLLIPKEDVATMNAIKAACKAAVDTKWNGKPPQGLNTPWHDGNGPKPQGGEYGEECHGMWVINVKTTQQPTVVDANLQRVMEATQFVSGDWCRVALNAYAYDNKRKGVALGLGNIQVVRKGEPLGNKRSAESDFEAWAEEGGGSGEAGGDLPWG
jgi:hypothetical protein